MTTDKQAYYAVLIIFALFLACDVLYYIKVADKIKIESYEIVKQQCVDSTGKVIPYDRYHPQTNYYVIYSIQKTIKWFPVRKIYSFYQKEMLYDSEFAILNKTTPRDIKVRIESYTSIFTEYKRANRKDSLDYIGNYRLVNWYELDFPMSKQ